MHTCSELYVCPTTCTSLSSSQQHLVICDLEINTIVMCGTLFALSRCSVFSTLNQFCHGVGTSLGLSHCVVVHIRGALLQLATSEYRLLFGLRSLLTLSERCFHRRCLTQRTLPLAGWQGSSGEKQAKGEVRRRGRIENREWSWRWREVKTPLKRSPKLISHVIPPRLNLGLN